MAVMVCGPAAALVRTDGVSVPRVGALFEKIVQSALSPQPIEEPALSRV